MQKKWVDSFFASNNYLGKGKMLVTIKTIMLEFDALKRLGIDDPVLYIKNHYGNSDIIVLVSCCIGYTVNDESLEWLKFGESGPLTFWRT